MRRRLSDRQLTEEQVVAETDKSPGVLLASGYIAGGAIAGIVIAFLAGVTIETNRQIEEWALRFNPFYSGAWSDLLSLLPFSLLGVVLYLVGLAVNAWAVKQLLQAGDELLARIPVVNSVYNSVKQVSDTLFSSSGNAFRKALLVQYPRQGSWTIAFQTGKPGGDVLNHLDGEYVSVYVPTTPNPTSGYLEVVPVEQLVPTTWTVDEAMAFIISGGAVAPASVPFRAPSDGPAAP